MAKLNLTQMAESIQRNSREYRRYYAIQAAARHGRHVAGGTLVECPECGQGFMSADTRKGADWLNRHAAKHAPLGAALSARNVRL